MIDAAPIDASTFTIAILCGDMNNGRHLKSYQFGSERHEASVGPWKLSNVDGTAHFLSVLSSTPPSVFVIGTDSILAYDGHHSRSLAVKIGPLQSVCRIEPRGERVLLGDLAGNLYLLDYNSAGQPLLTLELLGQTSISSTLTYLDSGFVFIGSTFGPSQLVRLLTSADSSTGNYFRVVDSFPNLGPIVDFAILDQDKVSAQSQIATCSGAFKDGSVQLVVNGIGVAIKAQVELSGIKGLWDLRLRGSEETILLVSFLGQVRVCPFVQSQSLVLSYLWQTRVLAMENEVLSEVDGFPFLLDQQTLTAATPSIAGMQCFVQVTTSSVVVIDASSKAITGIWKSPERIISASAHGEFVGIATDQNRLTLLRLSPEIVVQAFVIAPILSQFPGLRSLAKFPAFR